MKQYIVDAFTDRPFCGNPAAVCILDEWPEDNLMQNIARENNLSETAFAVREGNSYHLRWFTPGGEIDFCGHATLGTSYILFHYYETSASEICFQSQVGELTVRRNGELIEMDFPSYHLNQVEVSEQMKEAISSEVLEAYLDRDLLLVLPDEPTVRELRPNLEKAKQLDGLLVAVTAPSSQTDYDCVSRVFAPKLSVPEDPVTGSAHCMITPYWCQRLRKDSLTCFQASQRTGILYTRMNRNRITVSGKAVLYSTGNILERRFP